MTKAELITYCPATDEIEDALIAFVVIAAKHQDQWIFCRHKQRQTWEIPGGHREIGETIDVDVRRELWEETGAEVFALESR